MSELDVLEDFSFWLSRAREYGYSATDLYAADENAVIFFVPIPIVERNYKLWLFCFYRTEVVTPKLKDMILKEINENTRSKAHLIDKSTYFIIAGRIRGKITPTFGKKSIYVIRADYSWKIYEIISKAILTFVKSFRKNLRYSEDLLKLCDQLEEFANRLKKKGEEMKSGDKKTTTSSPTHHPEIRRASRKEAEEYLSILQNAEVVR